MARWPIWASLLLDALLLWLLVPVARSLPAPWDRLMAGSLLLYTAITLWFTIRTWRHAGK